MKKIVFTLHHMCRFNNHNMHFIFFYISHFNMCKSTTESRLEIRLFPENNLRKHNFLQETSLFFFKSNVDEPLPAAPDMKLRRLLSVHDRV